MTKRLQFVWLAAVAFAAGGLGLAQGMQQQAFVSPSGSDASGTGTASAPFQTVDKALGAVQAGGTITLEPGVYRTAVGVTRAVTLRSDASVPGAVGKTVIDASGKSNGIVVQGPAAAGTVIDGLTVKNAQKAGILVVQTSRVTVENNVVTANDQSCAGYEGCANPDSSSLAPQGTFTFTNSVPCGNPEFQKSPGFDCEALHLESVTNSNVVGNSVLDNLDGGIYLTDEAGPTSGNLVQGNVVKGNQTDCGITLASHNPKAVGHPDMGGVFQNTVSDNASLDNGAAGILMAGPMPGAGSYQNTITGNVVEGNGHGISVHSHTPGQDMNGNVIVGNFLSGNGADPDTGLKAGQGTGIAVVSAQAPLTGVKVQNNTIANEQFGVWFSATVKQPVSSGNRAVGNDVGTLVKIATSN